MKKGKKNPKEEWLVKFINKNNLKLGVELGVQKGYNFKYLVENTDDLVLHGVDIWSEKEVRWSGVSSDALEFQPSSVNSVFLDELKDWAKAYPDRVIFHRHFTNHAHTFYEAKSLDFVFIDAGHEYEDVIVDIKCWKNKIKPGGWLMGHDIDQPQVRRAVRMMFGDHYSLAKQQKIWYIQRGHESIWTK